ncbi:MAG: hypothetical protein RL556_160 [Actinomycetota bacterium]|jgi:pilus assembly protein CpaF
MIASQLIPQWFAGLLEQPQVTDVLVNRFDQVFIDSNTGLHQVASEFVSDTEVAYLAQSLIEAGGNHIDYANPICDVSIRFGEATLRVHAALANRISDHASLSIRIHRPSHHNLSELQAAGLINDEKLQQLEALIVSGKNFVISGGTGSGKTTLLRALLALNGSKRTIVIEDTPELMPLDGHFVALNARAANSEGFGRIDIQRLLVEALRMRPDRLVIGEVRGVEVITLVEALNLGVEQAAFTIHANSSTQVSERLQMLWMRAGRTTQDLQSQLSLQPLIVIHLAKVQGRRQVVSIETLSGLS